ncbi:MAG: dTDP-4-dehydrorhamnose 3,5-epimerase family protein [Myxococcota bacterium]
MFGVEIKRLKVIPDERGRLMEILRRDDAIFCGFGQVYLTTAWPGVVKAWHRHQHQTDHFCVVRGMIKLVLYDGRPASPTFEHFEEHYIGDHQPALIQIPAGVYHGFKNVSDVEALVINCVTEPYDAQNPDEERLPAHDGPIPYDWTRRDR